MTFKFPSFFSLLSYLCINICIFFHTTFLYTLRSSKWNQCEKGQIQKYIILCLFPCCRICRRRTLCLWSSGSPESCRTAWRRPWFTMYIVFFLVFVLAKNEGRAENYMVLIMNILHIAKCTLCSSTQYTLQVHSTKNSIIHSDVQVQCTFLIMCSSALVVPPTYTVVLVGELCRKT